MGSDRAHPFLEREELYAKIRELQKRANEAEAKLASISVGAIRQPTISELTKDAAAIALAHGFADPPFPEAVALMHSELSEALEDYRAHRGLSEVYYEGEKPCGIPSELADVVIRIMHFCGEHGIDLQKAILEKMRYNETRPYKHGGKKI